MKNIEIKEIERKDGVQLILTYRSFGEKDSEKIFEFASSKEAQEFIRELLYDKPKAPNIGRLVMHSIALIVSLILGQIFFLQLGFYQLKIVWAMIVTVLIVNILRVFADELPVDKPEDLLPYLILYLAVGQLIGFIDTLKILYLMLAAAMIWLLFFLLLILTDEALEKINTSVSTKFFKVALSPVLLSGIYLLSFYGTWKIFSRIIPLMLPF